MPPAPWPVPIFAEPIPALLGESPRFVARTQFADGRGSFSNGFSAVAGDLTLSVLPPGLWSRAMRFGLRIDVQPDPRWGPADVPDWCGVGCDIGIIRIRFPIRSGPSLMPLYFCLVRLPKVSASWMGTRLLLGTQFLSQSRARLSVDCQRPIPYIPAYQTPVGELSL